MKLLFDYYKWKIESSKVTNPIFLGKWLFSSDHSFWVWPGLSSITRGAESTRLRERAFGEIFKVWRNFWKIFEHNNVTKNKISFTKKDHKVSWWLSVRVFLSSFKFHFFLFLNWMCSILFFTYVSVCEWCAHVIYGSLCCFGMILHSLYFFSVDDEVVKESSHKVTKYFP
jgi:hypothetical protein